MIIELAARVEVGQARAIEGQITWNNVGGDSTLARFAGLELSGSADAEAVLAGRDGAVLAHATSAFAFIRQLEAAEAYARGDTGKAEALIQKNMDDLHAVAAAAPPAAATALQAQAAEFEETRQVFAKAPPRSAAGNVAAKRSVERNMSNVSRQAF